MEKKSGNVKLLSYNWLFSIKYVIAINYRARLLYFILFRSTTTALFDDRYLIGRYFTFEQPINLSNNHVGKDKAKHSAIVMGAIKLSQVFIVFVWPLELHSKVPFNVKISVIFLRAFARLYFQKSNQIRMIDSNGIRKNTSVCTNWYYLIFYNFKYIWTYVTYLYFFIWLAEKAL